MKNKNDYIKITIPDPEKPKKKKAKKPDEEWVETEPPDRLRPACPYCYEPFRPYSPDFNERKTKCKACGKVFKYWACYYAVTYIKEGE
jgi:hypothetical protein